MRVAGIFDDRKNVVEAEAITQAVIDHMTRHPNLSLGVVAMNASQADYIDALVETACAKDATLRKYCADWEARSEPFFVKNLENVQGDERDAILISFTYGPKTPGGPVPQRFGPINQEDGWRRLNVLYTRARSLVVAYTSMKAGDIKTDTGRKSLLALRGYLEFAESGELPTSTHTGRPADSDFEIAVAKAIRDLGYVVDHQIGVAGFYIDLGVRRSHADSRYLVGVECDGAAYHSSKVARDRDRLRQQILEGYGWTMHRIWSTDWFQDPRGQIAKLQQCLARIQ
jgi:very-short-patch-repair endonuclease